MGLSLFLSLSLCVCVSVSVSLCLLYRTNTCHQRTVPKRRVIAEPKVQQELAVSPNWQLTLFQRHPTRLKAFSEHQKGHTESLLGSSGRGVLQPPPTCLFLAQKSKAFCLNQALWKTTRVPPDTVQGLQDTIRALESSPTLPRWGEMISYLNSVLPITTTTKKKIKPP